MSRRLQELKQERGRLVERMKVLTDTAATEKRNLSTEEAAEWDKTDAAQEAVAAEVRREERSDTLARELAAQTGTSVEGDGKKPESPEERATRHAAAFRDYLVNGEKEMAPESRAALAEHRAQSVGTASGGGYTVPQGFSGKLEESLLAYGGMREASYVFATDKGNDLPWPTVDDTAQTGALLAENTQVANQDVTFGQITFKAYKYSSKQVIVSAELLQDSGVDIEAYLASALGTRLARITNTHFTTGDNAAKPQGVVTGASNGKTGTTGQTTSVIYDDLVDLVHAIDPAYRRLPGCAWMMHDSSLKVVKKIKDSQNRPLWLPNLTGGEPDTLLGYPIVINQDVAVMAANAKSILFGNFQKYFIRDTKGFTILRLSERFADYHQVAFLAFMRTDGRVMDAGTDPIKYYTNSAT